MSRNVPNDKFIPVHQLKYVQNKNAKTHINLLDQSFFIKYEDINIINQINLNTKNLNKIANFTPKLLKDSTINDQTIYYDFVPSGSLADLIYFKEKDIDSPLINNFKEMRIIIAYLIASISEIFIKYKLIHLNLTPENILFTNNMKPLIGGVEYIQSMTKELNKFNYEDSPFSIYIAPEVKEGNPVPESYSYSLSLLIYSILTFSFITQIPNKCPPNMEKSLFTFILSCCDSCPSNRPKVSDIKHKIAKLNDKLENLNFQEFYSSNISHGTKDSLIDLIEMQWPVAFYIVGNTFANGNIFDMTSKEAISFLNISKSSFSRENTKAKNVISEYYKKQEEIYISDIDDQIQKIKEIPKEASNISFYNDDPSLIDDQINISTFNTFNTYNDIPEYGFYGTEAITDSLEINEHLTFPLENLFVNELPSFSIENQTPMKYQSIANAKLACREKCNLAAIRPQKRNVNLHSLTQIGALQIATRMLSELNPDINYEIILNTGKGIHTNRPDQTTPNGNKISQPKNPNLSGNESILGSTLSNAIEGFIGVQPSVGENQGYLTMNINNIEKDNNDDNCYF